MKIRRLLPRSNSLVLLLAAAMLVMPGSDGRASAVGPMDGGAPIFRFTTDGFWLNLHHFLYVLGRAEAGTSDAGRDAVVNAPADQERGLATADAEAQQAWRDAVSFYAQGPSKLDAVFEESLYTATRQLAAAGETLEGVDLDGAWKAALEPAAPIYRRAWWPEHRTANRAWVEAIEPVIAAHGEGVLAFVTRAYGLPWPEDGFPIQLSGYSNWAGAYSTHGPLLVISSLDATTQGSTLGLEMLFHEAMHQWDDAHFAAMVAAAKAVRVRFPGGLDHAMLFFAAGEALRTVVPDHVPAGHQYGVWQRGSGRFLPILEATWRPYLHGVVSRDEALADLMRRFAKPDAG